MSLNIADIMKPGFRGGEAELPVANADGRVERRLLALTPDDVHDPTEIPTYLAGYSNGEFHADEASPPIMRKTDKDKYRTFGEDDTYLAVDVKGSIQGAIPEIDPSSSLADYAVVDRFVGSFVNDITEQNSTSYNARQAAGRRCQRAIVMDRELDVLGPNGLLNLAGSWDASVKTTLVALTKWGDLSGLNPGANSNPIRDLQNAAEASLSPITDAHLNLKVANAFFNHSVVRDYLRMHLGDSSAESVLRSFSSEGSLGGFSFSLPGMFGIKFHVCTAKYKTVSSGTPAYIMPNNVVFTRRPPSGVPMDGEEIATTYTFRRAGVAGVGYETRQFRVDGRGPRGGTMLVVAQADIAKMTSSKVGGIIIDALAA